MLRLLYAYDQNLPITSPPWHHGFDFSQKNTEEYPTSVFCNTLNLELVDQPLKEINRSSLLHRNEIWELWQDVHGNFIFANPLQAQKRHIFIDASFSNGKILGNFSNTQHPCYPLPQDLEIVFFINWLGKFKDVLLHASGVAYDGSGYVFCAESGAGKSTLAAALSQKGGVIVLGEDQILLRYLNGQFWVFGSPWHEDHNLCSQTGAPLKAVFFLEKTGITSLEPIQPLDGVTRLLQTAFIPYYRPLLVQGILDRLAVLSEIMPMFTLSYPLGSEVLPLVLSSTLKDTPSNIASQIA